MKDPSRRLSDSPAFRFVLTMGVVDLFGDMAYSGGASMNGLFLGSLGASAAVISISGGLSEFLNYITRGVSGYVADKIGRHWLLVFTGYVFNLLAVPALALAGQWQIAAGLIVVQGIGRGLRKPIVQAMLSHTTGEHGRGRGLRRPHRTRSRRANPRAARHHSGAGDDRKYSNGIWFAPRPRGARAHRSRRCA